MKRKVISAMLAFSLLSALITGCGGNGQTEEKKETNTETKIESGAEKKEADADEQTI